MMMSETLTSTPQEEIERLTKQRDALSARANEIRARLSRLPMAEANARSIALEDGGDSWGSVKTFFEMRNELEAELRSIEEDDAVLAAKISPLERQIVESKAEALTEEASKVAERQRKRIAKIAPSVQRILDLYPSLLEDETALVGYRQQLTPLVGEHHAYSMVPPVLTPLPTDAGALLDLVAKTALTDSMRGSRAWGSLYNSSPAASQTLLETIPDLRPNEGDRLNTLPDVAAHFRQ
jgi:hypothetical protein